MGRLSLGAAIAPAVLTACQSQIVKQPISPLSFTPLTPTTADDLVLAQGFFYSLVIKYGDAINSKEQFGTHNDFLHFVPLTANEGILWANHEYLHQVLLHNRKMTTPRTKNELKKEKLSIGGSLVHLRKTNDKWNPVENSHYNRRITALTKIPFHKNQKIMGKTMAQGMVTNCGGGFTPWKTILTCEENYDIYYGDSTFKNKKRVFVPNKKMRWYEQTPNPPEHYGWVVEVDPFSGKAKKHTALGRFEHEGATVTAGKSGKVVIYMGEDRKGGGIYKFVSDSFSGIDSGTLYVANTEKGQWLPLDLNKNPKLKEHFDTQLDVMIYASYAAELAGGTPQDRPEDIEIDPISGNVFVSLTNNADAGNIYGGLLKIEEKNNDAESLEFASSVFKAGGPANNFACPDNLAFDKKGNLWMTTDMAEYDIREGKFKGLGNNGLYYIPMHGPHAGQALQVASAPVDAEFTGPTFSPDYKTLFLSVQHPGAETEDPKNPTSTWPDRKGLPKSSVVAISGPALDILMS